MIRLALLFILFLFAHLVPVPDVPNPESTPVPAKPEAAELTFSSFSGGGPEFQVTLEDPGIAAYTSMRVDDPDSQGMPGAGYRLIYSFTGLKPGSTTLTVSARSPIASLPDSTYTLFVDDHLNVRILPSRELSSFTLYRTGYRSYGSFDIVTLNDAYYLSYYRGDFLPIPSEPVHALAEIVEKYHLEAWNGFDEKKEGLLDGEAFLLNIVFTDGTTIHAEGDNSFPLDYYPAMAEIQPILDQLAHDPAFSKAPSLP